MTLTNEQLQAMRDGTVGVSMGPWERVEPEFGRSLIETPNGTLCEVPWGRPDLGPAHRDAAHIARCSPEVIRELVDEVLAGRKGFRS